MINQQRQEHTRNQQEFNSEWVVIVVVCGAELQVHQIQCAQGRDDEDEFHEGVVNADEGGEQIQVPTKINDCEENLWLSRNA